MATTTKSYIGKNDLEFWTGATGTKTFSRNTSTGGSLTVRKAGNVVDVIEVHGSGTASQAALAAALSAASTDETTLELAQGTWQITSSVAIPATVILHLVSGAVFSVDVSQTLTINGPVWVDSAAAWYSGAGTVVPNGAVITGAGVNSGTAAASSWVNLVAFGPAGDDSTDDSAEFDLAFAAAAGGILFIPNSTGASWRVKNLTPRSNTKIIIAPGTVIKMWAGTTPVANDDIFEMQTLSNITIIGYGATIRGLNDTIVPPGPSYGQHNIRMDACSNCHIIGLTSSYSMADNLYIGSGGSGTLPPCTDCSVQDFTADYGYRQGITVISARNLAMRNIRCTNTDGTNPKRGIDIEPNHATHVLENIVIDGVYTENNYNGGIKISLGSLATAGGTYTAGTVSINITNHHDAGGPAVGGGSAFDVDGALGRIPGAINYTNGVSENAATYAFLCRNYSANGPRVLIDNMTVRNCNAHLLEAEKYGSAFVIFRESTDTNGDVFLGNITIRNPTIINDEGSDLTLTDIVNQGDNLYRYTTTERHGVRIGDWVLISGTTSASFDGWKRVRAVPSTTTFDSEHINGTDADETFVSYTCFVEGIPITGIAQSSGTTYEVTCAVAHGLSEGDSAHISRSHLTLYDGTVVVLAAGLTSTAFRFTHSNDTDIDSTVNSILHTQAAPLNVLYAKDLWLGNVRDVYFIDPILVRGHQTNAIVEFDGVGEVADQFDQLVYWHGAASDGDITISPNQHYPQISNIGTTSTRTLSLSGYREGGPSITVRAELSGNPYHINPANTDKILPYGLDVGDYIGSMSQGSRIKIKKTHPLEWSTLEETGRWYGETLALTATGNCRNEGVTTIAMGIAAQTATLPNGTWIGQQVDLVCTDGSNAATVSVSTHLDASPTTGTFNATNETWTLRWNGTHWLDVYKSAGV